MEVIRVVQVSVKRKDDELVHFKYVRREKKNGKWVYYYNDESIGLDGSIHKGETLTTTKRKEARQWNKNTKVERQIADRLAKNAGYKNAEEATVARQQKDAAEEQKKAQQASQEAKNKASQQRAARAEAIKKEEKKLKRNLPLQKAKKQINKGKKYLDKLFK